MHLVNKNIEIIITRIQFECNEKFTKAGVVVCAAPATLDDRRLRREHLMKERIKRETISDIITTEEIKNWNDNSIITISAQTGCGKSYFIKNSLYDYAKQNNDKILFLIHRTNCVDQFQNEIERDNKTDNITIKTYQSIESRQFNFEPFKYVISDEQHYFLSDSPFNQTTDISFNQIMSLENKVKIFMSGTGEDAKRFINEEKGKSTIDYSLPKDYSYIKDLTFFYSDNDIEQIIDSFIKRGEKGIVFIQSSERACSLYKKYKKIALFNCGKSDKHYKRYVDKKKIQDMLNNERFEEQILFTTSCLDAGVNLKDTQLVNVICDIQDVGSMVQCVGRKRIEYTDDYLNVYIKAITNKQLGARKKDLKNKVSMAEYLIENTVKIYVDKYARQQDYSGIVYDIEVSDSDKASKEINEVRYFKYKCDISTINEMLEPKKNYYGYVSYVARIFDKNLKFSFWDNGEKNMSLEQYLDIIVGKPLQKEEQNKLVKKIDLRVNGRQQRSYTKLNEGLKMLELPYVINSDVKKKTIDGKRKNITVWELFKIKVS